MFEEDGEEEPTTAGPTGECDADTEGVHRDVGNCDGLYFVESSAHCAATAAALGLSDTTPGGVPDSALGSVPHGCYWKGSNPAGERLWFNPHGDRRSAVSDRVSLCRCASAAPTAAPAELRTAPAPPPLTRGPTADRPLGANDQVHINWRTRVQ